MNKPFLECKHTHYNDDCYDKDEIIKKYGKDIFESTNCTNDHDNNTPGWMMDKAEMKKAYDWALETGFFDEEEFRSMTIGGWLCLMDSFYEATKPQYDIFQMENVIDENGNEVTKCYMGYYSESYEDAKARHESMDMRDLDIHYFTD